MDEVDFTILAATSVFTDLMEKCPPAEACRDAFDRTAKATIKMANSNGGFGQASNASGLRRKRSTSRGSLDNNSSRMDWNSTTTRSDSGVGANNSNSGRNHRAQHHHQQQQHHHQHHQQRPSIDLPPRANTTANTPSSYDMAGGSSVQDGPTFSSPTSATLPPLQTASSTGGFRALKPDPDAFSSLLRQTAGGGPSSSDMAAPGGGALSPEAVAAAAAASGQQQLLDHAGSVASGQTPLASPVVSSSMTPQLTPQLYSAQPASAAQSAAGSVYGGPPPPLHHHHHQNHQQSSGLPPGMVSYADLQGMDFLQSLQNLQAAAAGQGGGGQGGGLDGTGQPGDPLLAGDGMDLGLGMGWEGLHHDFSDGQQVDLFDGFFFGGQQGGGAGMGGL